MLEYFNNDPTLSECLALKGGTAINLTIISMLRLSVDIDLDYTKNNIRDEMLQEREEINLIINAYMAMEGYELSSKSKTYHSLDSLEFTYHYFIFLIVIFLYVFIILKHNLFNMKILK